MHTRQDRDWTAQVVISSEHAGLRPIFHSLEAEMMRVLARVDDPRDVRDYLRYLKEESLYWSRSKFGEPAAK